jgi:hypothetical protein
MKYLNNGGFNRNPMMRTTLMLTMAFLIGFVVVNFLLFLNKMDLTPDSIASYYAGNEEEFRPARSYQSMLEVTHTHLPMMAVVLLLLTHLVIFTPLSNTGKYIFIITAFCSASFNEGSNYLVRFVDPSFAWLKLFSFLTLQGSLILLVLILVRFMIQTQQEMKKEMENDLVEIQ